MKKLLQTINELLNKGEDIVLTTISDQSGSTPRVVGTKMVVKRDGTIAGTIGGGIVEAAVINEARQCFEQQESRLRFFDLTNDAAAESDMICGGSLTIFLEYIAADSNNKQVFQTLYETISGGKRAALVCGLNGNNRMQRFVVDAKGTPSNGDVPAGLLTEVKRVRTTTSAATVVEYEGAEYLVSYFSVNGQLFIVGCGHVAACTADAAAKVGFRVTAMDDRAEFANRDRFPTADEIRVLDSFDDCFADYDINSESFLVIVTRGHMHDLDVLAQALQTDAGYIGMIGSRKKRDAIYSRLLDRGITPEQLNRVHSPIGLSIEADTPEEIAISITAELIYKRATDNKRWQLM